MENATHAWPILAPCHVLRKQRQLQTYTSAWPRGRKERRKVVGGRSDSLRIWTRRELAWEPFPLSWGAPFRRATSCPPCLAQRRLFLPFEWPQPPRRFRQPSSSPPPDSPKAGPEIKQSRRSAATYLAPSDSPCPSAAAKHPTAESLCLVVLDTDSAKGGRRGR